MVDNLIEKHFGGQSEVRERGWGVSRSVMLSPCNEPVIYISEQSTTTRWKPQLVSGSVLFSLSFGRRWISWIGQILVADDFLLPSLTSLARALFAVQRTTVSPLFRHSTPGLASHQTAAAENGNLILPLWPTEKAGRTKTTTTRTTMTTVWMRRHRLMQARR